MHGRECGASHSALTVVEGRTELLVRDSEGVLVRFWEGIVCRAHVWRKVCADELWRGVGIAGFGGGLGHGVVGSGDVFASKERIHCSDMMYLEGTM